ncbi:MAG: hypothetical protein OXC81_04855 [Betaproteobacteria bacterium]|nr:hypothetical protein [Betaproteobacteria bacterium]
MGFAYSPPYGELHLDSSTPGLLFIDVFNIVVPPQTPLVAAAPYLALSRSNYEHWPPPAGAGFELSGTNYLATPGANIFFADSSLANSGEVGRRGYAFKFNEGSLLYADTTLTLATEDAYVPLVGQSGVTIEASQEFRPMAAPNTRLYAGLAVNVNAATVLTVPPQKTALVPGNQGLLPTDLLPGQVPNIIDEQMRSNTRGFMESYYHSYTSAATDVGSTDGMLVVGAGGAIGQFPTRVTMRGYDTLVNTGRNRLQNRPNWAGLTRAQINSRQPRVLPYAFDVRRPPSELRVFGRIELPAGSKFIYPPGYMFALGKSSFIHSSGIPRVDGEPNTGILRSPDQFNYNNYTNGAVVHLGKGAVLHEVRVSPGDILPDGSAHSGSSAITTTLTLASGGMMRYTQLFHHTPNFGDSLLPRTQQQAAFQVQMKLEHNPPPDLVRGGVTVGSLADSLEQDRDWHLVYPYHGLVVAKSQLMHPRLTVDFSDGSIGAATALTSAIRNVLGRAPMEYRARTRRSLPVAVDANFYPLLEESITLAAQQRRGLLVTVGTSYARTGFVGLGPNAAVEGQPDLEFDLNSGMKMQVNPADLWLGVAPVSVSYSETHTITIDVETITTMTLLATMTVAAPTLDATAIFLNPSSSIIGSISETIASFLTLRLLNVPAMTTITVDLRADSTSGAGAFVSGVFGNDQNVLATVNTSHGFGTSPLSTIRLAAHMPPTVTVNYELEYAFPSTVSIAGFSTMTMFIPTSMVTVVGSTLTIDSAFMQVRVRGYAQSTSPFVAPVNKAANDDRIATIGGSAPLASSRFTERSLHFSDSTIRANSLVYLSGRQTGAIPPDDSLLMFSGFADDNAIDFLDVVGQVIIPPELTTRQAYFRRSRGIGAANYGMMELDTDALMLVEDARGVEEQLLPAGTRVIFDSEVEVGEVMNAVATSVTMVPLPPGRVSGAYQARAVTASIGMLVRTTVAVKKVERLVPYARVGRGSVFYPIPNSADVMLYGDGEALLSGFPQTVTMYSDSFNALLGRDPRTGTVQTLVLTGMRVLLPAGSRVPRVWWQELPLHHVQARNNQRRVFPHVVVISSLGITMTMANLASPPDGVATVAIRNDYISGYHEVFSISPGTEIIADSIVAHIPDIISVPGPAGATALDARLPNGFTTRTLTRTRMTIPERSGFGIALETAGVPNLQVVAAEGGVLVQDYEYPPGTGTTHTVALGRVLPGQVIKSRSGGPGRASRIELDFASLDGDLEFEDFAAEDLIFSQNNPIFYAIADECRDLDAEHDRNGVFESDCADGDGEGLLVEVLPDEEVIMPEDAVSPPHLVIASRDQHGTAVPIEVLHGTATITVSMLQLRHDGQLRPLVSTIPDTASLPGYHVERIRRDTGRADPLAINLGERVTLSTDSPQGFEFYLADYSLQDLSMSVTVFHDRAHTSLGDPRQQIEMVAGGFTKGYEHLPAYRLVADPANDLTLGIDSMIADGGLPEPTRAGPGSFYDDGSATIDISGYRTLPGSNLGGAEFTVAADLPLRVPGFDNSYPIVDLIPAGTAVTIDVPRIETGSDERYLDLSAESSINLGPHGYAWQGVDSGPGVFVQTVDNTEAALRSYIKQLDFNAFISVPVLLDNVHTVTVAGTPQNVFPADGGGLYHYMPMGAFARSGWDSRGFRNVIGPDYGQEAGAASSFAGTAVDGKASCILCFGSDAGITTTVATTVSSPPILSSPVPFNTIDSSAGRLITVNLPASSTVATAVTLTLTGLGTISGTDGSGIDFSDTFARYYVVITLTDVNPGYLDNGVERAGNEVVFFVNSSVDMASTYDYDTLTPGIRSFFHNAYDVAVSNPLSPAASENAYVYDPATGAYLTVLVSEPHLLGDAYSELRSSAGVPNPPDRIGLLSNSELAARSVFTFGRYGDASELFSQINVNRRPDASAILSLPLPLNIHNTHNFPVVANNSPINVPFNVSPPSTPGSPRHLVNELTAPYMQVYLDTPGQAPDDSYVDFALPAGSNTDIILQVPVPVLTVAGEMIPGGSVINLRDGSVLRARRFNSAAPIEITLGGSGPAIGNIVGGGGVGRPQVVEVPSILQGPARLAAGITISILYAPEVFVGNADISVVALPDIAGPGGRTVSYQQVMDMNDLETQWMAVDYSIDNYSNDLRTSDAYLMRKNSAGIVEALHSQLDPTSNLKDDPISGEFYTPDAFLPSGHRLLFPVGRTITILPPQDLPRTHDHNLDTLDVFQLPPGTEAVYEVPYSDVSRSETGNAASDEFVRINAAALEIVTITVDVSNYGMPYHLPGLSSINVGGSVSVVIRSDVIYPDVADRYGRFIHATVSVAAIKPHTMDKARLIESSVYQDVYQNLWIRLASESVVVENPSSTITLAPGTIVNPILGTYLPPSGDVAHERTEAGSYILNAPQAVRLAEHTSFGLPALVIPAGIKVNTGQRRVRFTNVKGLIAHSPYPLEYEVECGVVDANLGRNTIRQGQEGVEVNVLQTVTIIAPAKPDARAGSGHPCVLLDLSENTDMDRHFIYSSKSLRSSDKQVQVRVNDKMRLIGGRLEL